LAHIFKDFSLSNQIFFNLTELSHILSGPFLSIALS
jgi:hypothetical protein